MKISQSWLADWVSVTGTGEALAAQLTMAGLEVDAVEPLDVGFSGVVVAEIREIAAHPDADRLRVCQVDAGDGELHQVVCGAPNARAGLKSALATVGARLPDGTRVRNAKLRGVASAGMLCSAVELGLGGEAEGILELPAGAPAGTPLQALLQLPDNVIDVDLTPNRGDCFSVQGVARELAALNDTDLSGPAPKAVQPAIEERFPVSLADPQACPRFVGRVVRGIRAEAVTPLWMRERLRRAGIRPLHPVVDVTNYVMLELGQPLHAYDLGRLSGGIVVRQAGAGERLVLLDEREVALEPDMLLITDESGPIGLAGVMGGASTAVSEQTTDVFLEGAHFAPTAIAGRARRLGLHTDASLRFERGVDPAAPAVAVERATELLVGIAGGQAGPLDETVESRHLPERAPVRLRRERLARVLGIELEAAEVERIFARLGMTVQSTDDGWQVTPPSFRFDIAIEEDLIEELARIHGYDRIPRAAEQARLTLRPATETRVPVERARTLLVDRDYHEAITYSFTDPKLQALFEPGVEPIPLANPISSELAVMRASLWPGLVDAVRDNLSRQQPRVRLFEIGAEFRRDGDGVRECAMIAGAAVGSALPEQWSAPRGSAEFFDIKSDVEALLGLGGDPCAFTFTADEHPALHPGQSARIRRDGEPVGWLGTLHPRTAHALDLDRSVVLFALEAAATLASTLPWYAPVSRFPAVRRDLAVIVDDAVAAGRVADCVRAAAGELLTGLRLFDVYRGKNVDSGSKSIALGLILQAASRTLTDQDVERTVQSVVDALRSDLGARIRD